jgi:uncharacterized protein
MSTKKIARALFPLTRISILSVLFLSDEKSIHLRELARQIGMDPTGVKRELRNLLDAGILLEEKSGNQKLYRINKKCLIYNELKGLIIKTSAVGDVLKEAMEPLKDRIKLAFIYGSVAKGTDDSESDIDLMIVGKIKLEDLFYAFRDIHGKLGREVNPYTISISEFKKRIDIESDFVARIWKEKKIVIIGDEDEFTGVA